MTEQKIKNEKGSSTPVVITEWQYTDEPSPAFKKLMSLLLRPERDRYGKEEDRQHR